MFLNSIQSAPGARKKSKRVGRGIGCTDGKTCGRGHKGQKARAGGYHKVGFEGGQMPLQRRLPKVGFTSRQKKYSVEVNLNEISSLDQAEVTIKSLIDNNLVPIFAKKVKIIKSGEVQKVLFVKGLSVTEGARQAILAAGGQVEE